MISLGTRLVTIGELSFEISSNKRDSDGNLRTIAVSSEPADGLAPLAQVLGIISLRSELAFKAS